MPANAKRSTSSAIRILHSRYVKGDPGKRAAIEAERLNASIAQAIRELRIQAGLTQTELARLVGTSQSVISRLEDADYQGHSLSMLNRIAKALNQRVAVGMAPTHTEARTLRYVFRVVLRNLRRANGLTVAELAQRIGTNRSEVVALERGWAPRPSPATLQRLSRFYRIPYRRLAVLAGIDGEVPEDIRKSASRFAALSDSFAGLTKQERRALDDFVKLLRQEA